MVELLAAGFLAFVPPAAVSFARGLCVQPSLQLLGKRAGVCGASVATGYGSLKLTDSDYGAVASAGGFGVIGSFVTGTVSGGWTAGHGARCAVQLGYEALTGGPRA